MTSHPLVALLAAEIAHSRLRDQHGIAGPAISHMDQRCPFVLLRSRPESAHVMMMVNCTQSCRECKSGHLAPVGYYDTAHATGLTMQRAWARAWVVRGDTTGQEHRTCEWAARAVARSLAFNVCRSGARLSLTALAPHRRRVVMMNYTASKPTEG